MEVQNYTQQIFTIYQTLPENTPKSGCVILGINHYLQHLSLGNYPRILIAGNLNNIKKKVLWNQFSAKTILKELFDLLEEKGSKRQSIFMRLNEGDPKLLFNHLSWKSIEKTLKQFGNEKTIHVQIQAFISNGSNKKIVIDAVWMKHQNNIGELQTYFKVFPYNIVYWYPEIVSQYSSPLELSSFNENNIVKTLNKPQRKQTNDIEYQESSSKSRKIENSNKKIFKKDILKDHNETQKKSSENIKTIKKQSKNKQNFNGFIKKEQKKNNNDIIKKSKVNSKQQCIKPISHIQNKEKYQYYNNNRQDSQGLNQQILKQNNNQIIYSRRQPILSLYQKSRKNTIDNFGYKQNNRNNKQRQSILSHLLQQKQKQIIQIHKNYEQLKQNQDQKFNKQIQNHQKQLKQIKQQIQIILNNYSQQIKNYKDQNINIRKYCKQLQLQNNQLENQVIVINLQLKEKDQIIKQQEQKTLNIQNQRNQQQQKWKKMMELEKKKYQRIVKKIEAINKEVINENQD